jgi:tetratricopeptide (TPR) repeat protein
VLVGRAFEELGDDEEAHYHFSRAITLPASAHDDRPADAWLALSHFNRRRGEFVQAETVLNDGLRAVPKNAAAPLYAQLAALFENGGRVTEAHAMLERLYHSGIRSSDLLTRYGRVLGQLGHHEQAIACLEEAVAESDADGMAYHMLALSLEAAERPAEALAAARQAAILETESGDLLLHAGQLSLEEGDIHNAVEYLQAAASRQPDSAATWEWLGRACEAMGDWQGALDAYWLSVRIDPGNPQLQYRIGVACTRLGQTDTAITALNEAAGRLPDDPAVIDALAEAFEAAGWWDNAATTRQKGAALSPSDLHRHIAWARAARLAGDFDFAEEALTTARLIELNAGELLLEWSALQRARGDLAGAIQHLRNLVRDSVQPALLWRAGEDLMELGQVEVGARAFGRAVDLDPSNPRAQARLGDASAAMGNHAQALAAYQAAAELEPHELEHQMAIASILWKVGDFKQARDVWETVLEQRPGDVHVLERLAEVNSRLNDPAAAMIIYERAATQASLVDADAGPLWREAGRAALELGELEKAQICLSRACQAIPEDPEVQSLVGALADRLGKLEEALEAYRLAVALAPAETQRAYQLQLADALTRHEHDQEALGVWGDLVQGGEGDETVSMLEQMGRLHARAGNYGNADRTLRAALDQAPEDTGLQLMLAGVVVELAEELDFQKRAGLAVEQNPAALEEAISWLEMADGARAGRDLARGRLLQGGSNEAILGLKRYLTSSGNPAANDLKAQRALGVAYRQAGLLDASLDALTTAIKVSPTDTRTAVELARTYLAAGNARSALTLLKRLLEVNPDDAILLYHCALAGEAAGEMGSAIETLKLAVELDPSVVEWNRVLSGWLRGEGNALAALSFADSAAMATSSATNKAELARVLADLDRTVEAIQEWQEALTLSPDDATGWAELGSLFLDIQEYQAALDCYDRAISLTGTQPVTAHYLGRAQALISLGNMDEADRTIKSALELDPQSPAVHAGRGNWLAAQGQWQEALVSYQTAAMRAGNGAGSAPAEQADYLLDVARAYHALGSSEQALQVLEGAAKLAPHSGDLFALLGDVYQEVGKRDLARQAFQQAAKVSLSKPNHVLRLAQFLQKEGQLDQALDWLVKGNAVQPSAALWVETGRVYEQRKQRGKQMEALHRAVELEPDYANAHYEIGLAYKQRKEYQLAIKAFEKTVQLEPANQDAHKQLSAVVAMSLAGTLSGRKR